MAIDERQLVANGVYETAGGQRRKVRRLTLTRVDYQVLKPDQPRYQVSVPRGKFAADAVRRIEGDELTALAASLGGLALYRRRH